MMKIWSVFPTNMTTSHVRLLMSFTCHDCLIFILFASFMTSFAAGHRIEQTPEVPLVITDKIEEYKKTKQAVGLLRKVKAWVDIEKVKVCCH